jgi:cytosine/creatinine deaminase
MTETLSNVALPGRVGAWSVALADGVVASVEPAPGPVQGLVLPAFADLHVHADRAFIRAPRPPESLLDAIELTAALRAKMTDDDMRGRAERLLGIAHGHGTVRVRTHADVDEVVGVRAVHACLAAAETFSGRVDVEVVAFADERTDPATADGARRVGEAAGAGATHVGAVPALYPDPVASIDALLSIAHSLGLPVDLHLDEDLDPAGFLLEALADSTVAHGLEGRVTAGHCCALASVAEDVAERTIAKVAAAGIEVIALPALNLYLQDRGHSPRRRGITLVRGLLAAGVPVRFGSDNVRDLFYPFGDADPLEAAWLASVAAHVDDEDALLAGICAGRTRVEVGDVADLVAIDASSFRNALARRPAGRIVYRGGVAQTPV